MKLTGRKILFFGFTALVAVALFHGARLLSRQREEIAQLQRQATELETKIAAERQAADNETRYLTAAEKQLTEIPQPPGSPAREVSAGETEIATWLARVRRLKQLFEERPDQRIPEMRLLTDEDWLRATRDLELTDETKIRRALARVRAAAVSRFTPSIRNALNKYMKSGAKTAPGDIAELGEWFTNPADADLLSRYEIGSFNPSAPKTLPWMIQEKAPVDADYDSRNYFYPEGGVGRHPAPLAWIPNYHERADNAYKAYLAANHGVVPAGPKALLPYYDPPLDPAAVEKIIKATTGW